MIQTTTAQPKSVGVPKTNKEKYEKLKLINPLIELFKETLI